VVGVGDLADGEALLHREVGVGEERPRRAGRDLHLVRVVQRVRQHGDHLREGHRQPLRELEHLALVLALARAVLATAEHQHHEVVALEVGEPVRRPVLVGQLEVGQGHARLQVAAHRGLLTR
jgi:hypothetical protein